MIFFRHDCRVSEQNAQTGWKGWAKEIKELGMHTSTNIVGVCRCVRRSRETVEILYLLGSTLSKTIGRPGQITSDPSRTRNVQCYNLRAYLPLLVVLNDLEIYVEVVVANLEKRVR